MPQRLELVAANLNFPVSFAFAPNGQIFYNELRTGRIRLARGNLVLREPMAEVAVVTGGERGLIGLALHPGFPNPPWLYVYHTTRTGLRTENRVTRLTLTNAGGPVVLPGATAATPVLTGIPAGSRHNGGILGFQNGHLFITTGDSGRAELAQDPESLAGKVLRITADGAVPADNPFPGSPVYTLGHRNVFGLAFQPRSGRPYITKNGTDRDDEINRLVPGGNYGWPVVLGPTDDPRFVPPLLTFTPNIAPTGAVFYTGRRYGRAARGALFFGDWLTGTLRRLVLAPPSYVRVLRLDAVAKTAPTGILAVVQGPDEFIYFSTPDAIWRVAELNE